MSYRILRTDKANDQLYDLIQYIAADSSIDTALNYLDKLESAVMNLAEFPYSGAERRQDQQDQVGENETGGGAGSGADRQRNRRTS